MHGANPRPSVLFVEKATIYQMGPFGAIRREAAALELTVTPAGHVQTRLRKPRARSWDRLNVEREPSVVVLEGWGHPEQDKFDVSADGRSESTRYGSFDPKWRPEFDAFMAKYLAENPQVRVLGDYRGPLQPEELQAAAG